MSDGSNRYAVAVVGYAGRFPGARNPAELWANLAAGVESIAAFTAGEALAAGADPALVADPSWVGAGGVLDGIDLFDPQLFGFTPREATVTDPQHRLFLECAWEALESAGAGSDLYRGVVGVWAGTSASSYLSLLQANPEAARALGRFRVVLGNDKDYLATWTAYKLNLRGPAITVQTACSTSLVAVHLACQSLLNGECDLALAGGVSVSARQKAGYVYQEGGINSPDGHCRAFDAAAQGTVGGSGVAVVTLKRLEDALADGDPVRAVILGTAVNNDGSAKIGFTAPSVEGQARVIGEALAVAGVDPDTLGMIEAHGTGTPLGDPVEVEALTRAFRARTGRRGFCALGSVKANLGHLDAAAGATGLIKAVLALEHGRIPPALHFQAPNPRMDLDATPFVVPRQALPWERGDQPRRAGVSSFGIGGTNAHAVLEEGPERPPSGPSRETQLLLLSARSAAALEEATARLARHLREHPEEPLADVAHTLRVGRRTFEHRRALVCHDRGDHGEALAALDPVDRARVLDAVEEPRHRPVAFLFPGQGAQAAGMGAELDRTEPVFRRELDRCAGILRPHIGFDLRDALGSPGDTEAEERLARTELTQPALFAVEWALARLWMSWGVRPDALLGHSVGQWVAACLAGVFSLEDACALVALRGRLLQRTPPGAMLAVRAGEPELAALLPDGVTVTAINAPGRSTVAGPGQAVEALAARLDAAGIPYRRLRTSHAFHTPAVEPVLNEFRAAVEAVERREPEIPLLSNLDGGLLAPEEATDPEHWVRHLREPVRFSDGLRALLADPARVLLEVGPGTALCGFARRAAPADEERAIVPSLAPGTGEQAAVLDGLARLWLAGVEIDWAAFAAGEARHRLALPGYPFQRQSFWVAPAPAQPVQPALPAQPADTAPGPAPVATAGESRRGRLRAELLELLASLVGVDASHLDPRQRFLEAGIDSLLLIQAARAIEGRFGVAFTMSQLLVDTPTLDALIDRLDAELPAEAFAPAPVPVLPPDAPEAPAAPPGSPLDRIFAEQLRVVSEVIQGQLAVLRATGGETAAAPAPTRPAPAAPRPAGPETYVPYEPLDPGGREELSDAQRAYVQAFIARFTARTAGSKRRSAEDRGAFADNRNTSGFRLLLKEMVYPIVVDRAHGGRIRDVDGNEYVDITMGFGVHLFGHGQEFLDAALRRQLDRGMALGPQSDMAGEAARRFCALTGQERVAFCNSGTEAVLFALRLARTATGRDKVAFFAGSYHGIADTTLARAGSVPVAPGIPRAAVQDVLVLPYAEASALDAIAAQAGELAAVLVEPVQSRRPDLQPAAFLRDLRRLTAERGVALVFDEVITGLRSHPRGAQGLFGVEADLATYGKVLGGGMPIGAVAGRAAYMDGIDGGAWSFGDGSFPSAVKTYFAGTFCKHPLTMAATLAVLERMQEEGPALQEGLTRRAADLCARINAFCERGGYPLRAVHFASLFRLVFPDRGLGPELFYAHLLERGVYLWEGRTSFVATAHTDADLDHVAAAVADSLVALRAAGFFPEPAPEPGREPRSEPVSLPLTEGQRQIWFVTRLGDDASRAYNEAVEVAIDGPLDAGALARAFARLVARHDALRLVFDDPAGETQTLRPAASVPLPVDDLAGAPAGEVERLAARIAGEPFDLAAAPPVRAHLARLAPERHRLFLTLHHLIVDGWSFGVLLRELSTLYRAERRGGEAGLPPAPKFRDFACRALPATGEASAAPPPLDLPLDSPRPPVRTFRGGRVHARLGADLAVRLRRRGAESGATLTAVLLAGFAALVHRLGGGAEAAVGVASAGQVAAGAEGLVGYCIDLLPVVVPAAGERSFADTVRGALAALDAARGSRPVQHGREASRLLPLAAVLNLDKAGSALDFDGLPARARTLPTGASKFELYLNFVEGPGGLDLEWEFAADLFHAATVERWAGTLGRLLDAAAGNPELPVEDLPLLAPAERHQLLVEWNDTGSAETTPDGILLHHLIARQAARTPDATAVRFEGEALSYAGLDAAANRLARHLRRLGVGPETAVGVCVERSVEMVVALLAVLKAGGAYVPLDPDYPAARLARMLEDLPVPVLLTRRREAAALPPHGAREVLLDEGAPGWRDLSGTAPGVQADPDGAAYVIFTSGSTGRPKGVVNTHRGIVNRLLWMQRQYGLGAEDRVLQKTPFSFDVSVWELFWPLLAGAELVMARPGGHRDGAYLAATIAEAGVTTLHFVPSMLAAFLEEPGLDRLTSLRRVVASGEALPLDLARRFHERLGRVTGAVLENLYGPTEAAVDVTAWPVREDDGLAVVPIGRPVANTSIHLLDRAGRPVPLGVAGELFIGGIQVARGYAGRPDLTAERFVPDPASPRPGARLYRTGDLARRLPGGAVDFLGRLDHQVKLRGVRIELGEIEAALLAHPGVREAVVVTVRDSGDTRLVAFAAPPVPAAELRAGLSGRLPEAMVPSAFVALDALPLSPNGKADRAALTRLAAAQAPVSGSDSMPPRTPLEELVAGQWAAVLGRDAVGVRDNFFDLGGHSLHATRLLARLRDALGLDIPLRRLFEGPTVEALCRWVESERAGTGGEAGPPPAPVPRTAPLPLSFAQERLWFLDQLQPGLSAYNLPRAARLAGPLDPERLAAALSGIVARHEALRTRFPVADGAPVQLAQPAASVPVPRTDLGALPSVLREAEARRLVEAEAARPFDLAAGPLLRALLIRLGPEDHLLALTVHHIAADGWSLGILLKEAGALYAGTALPALPIQYADYAAWQRSRLDPARMESELSFWRGQLAGAPPVLDLPTDRPRPAVQTTRGAWRTRPLAAAAADAVQNLSRERGATPFMVLAAALQALLARWSGQDDVSIGTPVAGRLHAATEPLIGCFLNTLVLRGRLDGDPAFAAHLARVRETALDAFAHQEIPFDRLVAELAPGRDLGATPLFQVMLVVQNTPPAALELPGLRIAAVPSESPDQLGMMTLSISTVSGSDTGLAASLGYNRNLFDAPTVERFLGHFEALLAAAAARPADPALGLPVLGEAEVHQVCRDWNDAAARVPEPPFVHSWFERRARATPDAVAVIHGEVRTTFAELDHRSGVLARLLQDLGAGPDTRVGVCAPRSTDLIAGLLGVLRAGAAYVPLDLRAPAERKRTVLADAGVVAVLAAGEPAAELAGGPAPLVRLDDPATWRGPEAPRPVSLEADNLAYVLYTSGSTGTPKGVLVPHGAVANVVSSFAAACRLGPEDRVLQQTTIAFDVSVNEIFPVLAAGGATVLLPDEEALDFDRWTALVVREGVTVLGAAPSLLARLNDVAGDLGKLRLILSGGEALASTDVDRLLERAAVVNGYGPTETTVACLSYPLSRLPAGAPAIPIGRPVDNGEVFVLDRRGRLCGIGVPGELVVGGAGVARGYLGSPALTAERFVPHPLRAGERVYRTGDRARWLPGGDVEFLGRLDQQIKIRGVRIEPGEIEAALAAHPAIAECAVLAREDRPGQKRLVAYVSLREGVETAALRAFLAERLPEAMVPAAWVVLDRFPLSASGKIDRKALPAPALDDEAETETLDAAPRSPLAELIAGLWCEVLGVGRVRDRDDFFALGGHSLLATRLVARLREVLTAEVAEVPVRAIFESPVFAAFVDAVARDSVSVAAPPLVRRSGDGPAPLSFAQERLWFLQRLEPDGARYNMPTALRLAGAFDPAAFAAAVNAVAGRHEVLRTTYHDGPDGPVQVVGPVPQADSVPLVDLAALPEARREAEARVLAAEEAARAFDLERGPVLRARLLRLAGDDHVALLTLHHIACDAWSAEVFARELAAFQAAAAEGRPAPLPPLPVQVADHAAWQRAWFDGEALERGLAAWRRRLEGAPGLLDLPLDRPRPAVAAGRGDAVSVPVPAGLAAGLAGLSRRQGTTLFMTLLAGWGALLARLSGQEDVVIGTPVADRGRAEVAGLIGCFLNTLPLRLPLGDGPAFRDLLGRARAATLDAWSDVHVPFDRLVGELAPERSLQYAPVFQALLTLNRWRSAPGLAGARQLDVGEVQAKLDVSLVAEERDGDRGDLRLTIEIDRDLLDRATARRWLGHLLTLLDAAVAEVDAVDAPDTPVQALPLLSPAEAHQLAAEWNDTALPELRHRTVVSRFAAQAAATPDATAVTSGDDRLTYAELDRRSADLARRLRGLGAGPGSLVALCSERTLDLPVGVLGALRSGAAYVPLDPAQPANRLAFQLQDSGALLAVTGGPLPEPAAVALAAWSGKVLPAIEPGEPDPGELLEEPEADSLAYLIYTSGSTGRPKAVQVEHGSLANVLRASRAAFSWRAGDALPCLAPAPFDIFLFELLNPLLTGGTVHLVPLRPVPDVEALLPLLARCTHVHAVPALMRLIVDAARRAGPERFGGLREIFTGGDSVPADLLDDLRRAFPAARVRVLYGPTEGTIIVSSHAVPAAGPARPLLGRPLANTDLHVLDAAGALTPIGVAGELWIGGAGVARGYLRRDELTAERFPERDGRRFYRTGDRARRLAGGELEFLGRADQQVKLRGFRIELGEVEAALAAHPGVAAAVATVVDGDGAGDRRLAAFFVAADEAPSEEELRAFVARTLPDYMVPSAIQPIAAIPVSAHGKVDRRALPRPDWTALRTEGAQDTAGGRLSPTAEVLAAIWTGLLGAVPDGPGADFFALGGHSLLAARLTSRVREAFGVDLPVRAVFETPDLGGLAHRVEELRRAGLGLSVSAPAPRAAAGPAPLSFAQERLWFLQQLDPGSAGYNIPLQLRLRGDLDTAALAAALGGVAARHEVLRTVYLETEGAAVQVVLPPADPAVPLPIVDLAGLPEERRQAAAAGLAADEAASPFDLARGPVLRARLLRLGNGEHAVLLTLHHIAADGWSIGLLMEEVAALYTAAVEGRPAALPALPVQYADFAAWQRDGLQGDVLDAQLAFWRRHLAGAPPLLSLPLDRPRPATRSFRGGSQPIAVPADVTEGLAALARREGATLFMVALAAWRTLLARLSGQDQVVVGTASAGRHHVATERLIGFFVNTLPLRGDLSGDPDFQTLLRRAREDALGAFAHDDLPLERLVAELAPQRSLSHTPLFQVMLVLQNAPPARRVSTGLRLEPLAAADGESAKFDLSLNLAEAGGVLEGSLTFNRDLFDPATARRWAGHLGELLAAVATNTDRPLAALPLLTAAERAQLAAWNDTAVPLTDLLIHDLVLAQAARTPDAPAVRLPDGSEVSYGELAERVHRLARVLQRRGVGPEAAVGVCLERSVDLLVALLGVLAAGGAYVPLDPTYPTERLAAMVEDAAVALILTDRAAAAALPPGAGPVLLLDEARAELDTEDSTPPAPVLPPDGLAYVLFTSGSTGRPKGVMVSHRAVVNRLLWLHRLEPLGPDDRVLLKTPYSFDVSVWEMFGPLLAGACLVLVRPGGQQDTAHLAEVMAETGVTVVHFVASMLSVVLEEPGFERCRTLRLILNSGETLPAEVQRRAFERTPARLLNMYGPTEMTVECSLWECRRDQARIAPPIGRPADNTQLWVADAWHAAAPVSVAGELWIGGAQLARGYASRPELTAERFVPDPFGPEPGGRLYRSGDLCRYRPDGSVDFLGRVDFQVKVRGVRVELGEIESVLAAHPTVREAVVLARRDAGEDARLVAYVVPADPETGIDIAVLRGHLERRLTANMIPSAFVVLGALPLNRNGKVDRDALPAPEARAGHGVAPRDEVERGVAAVWEEILGVSGVSVDDDFFALGGHSLLAVRLMARLRRHFAVDLPLATLFEAPTVESLATRIREKGAGAPASAVSPLVPLQRGGSRPPFFCVHPIGGEVLVYRQLARRLGPEQPFYGLQAPGLAAGAGPRAERIEEMAARYVAAVREAYPSGPYLLGGWSFGCLVAYEMARQLTDSGADVALVALFDGAPPGRKGPKLSPPVVLAQLLREEARQKGIPFDLDLTEAAALPAKRGVREVVRRAREAGLLPEEMTVEVIEQLLAGFRRRTRAAETYKPRGVHPGRLTFFRAGLRDADLLAVLAAHGVAEDDPTGGWAPFSARPVEVHTLETYHDLLLREPAVGPLAEALSEEILRALEIPTGDLTCHDSPRTRSAPSAS